MRNAWLVAMLAVVLSGCSQAPEPPPPALPEAKPAVVVPPAGDAVEGLRIATRVGCNGCHGKGGGGKVFLENKEFGRIVAPNLTQRRALYDDAGLEALLRHGRTHDGHVPWGMPIKMFQHLSDQELRDITAWLRATPAVENAALPEGKWSPSLAAATANGTHPWLEDMRPDPGNQPPMARPREPMALGKYLAMSTCGECHGWDLNGFDGDDAPSPVVAKAYSPEHCRPRIKDAIPPAGEETR